MNNTNIAELLAEQARLRPDQSAILGKNGQHKRLTFAELNQSAAELAAFLGERGIKTGERVLLLTPLSAELYITLAALWRIGLVAVVIDPSAGLQHMRTALRRTKPSALVGTFQTPRALPLLLLPEIRNIPLKVWFGPTGQPPKPHLPPASHPKPLDAEHPALMTLTSGSTGQPKIAQRSHGFLSVQHRVLARHLGYSGDLEHSEYSGALARLDLVTLPIFALVSLASGRGIVLPDVPLKRPAQINGKRLLRQLIRVTPPNEKLSSVVASPALLENLAQSALSSGQILPFDHIFVGGGPVFWRTLELLRQAAPNATLTNLYGSTEVEPMAHHAWQPPAPSTVPTQAPTPTELEITRTGGGLLVGSPVPELETRIIEPVAEPLGAPCFLPIGEAGELLVSGEHVLQGYLDGQGDLETKWCDPQTGRIWHRSGDIVRLDDQGRLWLMGRVGKQTADHQGVLFPLAVEAAAMCHADVKRAALLPQTRILCVQWNRQITQKAQQTKTVATVATELSKLLKWAKLDEIRSVSEIPLDRRHNAKVDYTRLQRLNTDINTE